MTTIMPQSELMKKAVAYVADHLASGEAGSLPRAVEDASRRFNLGPKEAEFLIEFFQDAPQQQHD